MRIGFAFDNVFYRLIVLNGQVSVYVVFRFVTLIDFPTEVDYR